MFSRVYSLYIILDLDIQVVFIPTFSNRISEDKAQTVFTQSVKFRLKFFESCLLKPG